MIHYLALALLRLSMVDCAQTVFETSALSSQWQVSLSRNWDVTSPFPIHAREQNFLSPAFPLDVSPPYRHEPNRSWPSSYADHGQVTWSTARSDKRNNLRVSFPGIRWDTLRSTEGWAALQYHSVLRTTLTVYPPASSADSTRIPRLLANLKQGSFFSLVPLEGLQSDFVPEWHSGNIYGMERAPPRALEFPASPSLFHPTTYDVFVSGDYEIRLFGDPQASGGKNPTLEISLTIEAEIKEENIVREATHDVLCDFVDGFAFGDAIGVGLRSVDGWWTAQGLEFPHDMPHGIRISLLSSTRIAPSQTRIVPIKIAQTEIFRGDSLTFYIAFSSAASKSLEKNVVIAVTLNVHHVSRWGEGIYEVIKASYFYAESHATAFLVKPPKLRNDGRTNSPILALHGAGVDIFSSSFWPDAIPRQEHSWIVMPAGRTAWGLDWHGPSASEAWSSIEALGAVLRNRTTWKPWQFEVNAKAVVIGHSNGGQGAWYLASRYPDKVLGVVAAAGYLKSQLYVTLTHSRAGHYIDPSLRAVLESSLTPDDNDLFLSNLAHMPVLAIHGADDNNVPTWHTREHFSVVQSWGNGENITYREDAGKPHWYSDIFQSEGFQTFLDSIMASEETVMTLKTFTLTVAYPAASGPLHGWKIERLKTPGRLSRLQVSIVNASVYVRTVNVDHFSVMLGSLPKDAKIRIDETTLLVVDDVQVVTTLSFVRSEERIWSVWSGASSQIGLPTLTSLMGRSLNLLDSAGPLSVVIPSSHSSPKALSVALRIAHDLNVYHKLDVEIITDEEATIQFSESTSMTGNAVIIGGPTDNKFGQQWLTRNQTEFVLKDNTLYMKGRPLAEPSLGILFTHPHLTRTNSLALFLTGTDDYGFERALRLFPLRTGVPVPDWLVIGQDSDRVGAAGVVGAGVWNDMWRWNEPMSWIQ